MKYVALLRGINVGGNNKVDMKLLKKAFEDLGYANVSTYINSGNVIFESSDIDFSSVEKSIEKQFGFPVRVLIMNKKDLIKIAKDTPSEWQNDLDQRTDVLFLYKDYSSKKSLTLVNQKEGVDRLLYSSGAIIWNIKRKDYSKSGMKKFMGTEVYKNMTARNINTLRKLVTLLEK